MTNYRQPEPFELALTREGTGELVRPLAAAFWWALGDVRVDEQRVYWSSQQPDGAPPTRKIVPAPGMLEQFVRLHDGSPEQIASFARTWGILGFCQHDLLVLACESCRSLTPHTGAESLDNWRIWAGHARALLVIASRLHDARRPTDAEWRAVFARYPAVEWERDGHRLADVPWWPREIEADRWRLAAFVNQWLDFGGARIGLNWDGNAPSVLIYARQGPEPGRGPLFPQLGAQLLMAAARSEGLAWCSACGYPYFPPRRPAHTRRNYCADCRQRAARRDAARAYRQRKREGA